MRAVERGDGTPTLRPSYRVRAGARGSVLPAAAFPPDASQRMKPPPYLDVIPTGVVAHREGIVVYANDAFCDIVGRPRDTVVGAHYRDFVSPDEAQRLEESAARRRRGEALPDSWRAVEIVRPDGSTRVAELRITRHEEEVVAVVRDVTGEAARRERRIALSHLGVSLQSCRSEAELIRRVHEGVTALELSDVWMSPHGEGLRVDEADRFADGAFERRTGTPVEGFVGVWTPFLRKAWADGEAYSDDALDETGRFLGPAYADVGRDIAAQHALYRALAVRIDLGDVPQRVLVLRGDWLHPDDLAFARLLRAHLSAVLDNARYLDGTRRRMRDLEALNALARKALVEAQRTSRAVLDAAVDIAAKALAVRADVLLLGDDGDTLQAVTGVFDLRVDVADVASLRASMRHDGWSVIHDLEGDARTQTLARAHGLRGSAVVAALFSQRGPRGVIAAVDPAGRRFSDEDVTFLRAIAGVTEVALENAELHEEARARLKELRETQARLVERERLAALGEVAAVVAHEVRNPLGVIFNAVASLRRRFGGDGEAGQLVEIVREEAGRLNQIVGDLLDFARPSAPVRKPEALVTLVEGALEAAFARVLATTGASSVHSTVDVPDDLPLVVVDGRQVRQALLNVCLNAIEAMPSGGDLVVSARAVPERSAVLVTVRDTGAGIPTALRERVSEPFYTTRASGTGLGLAVVKRVVEAHGGALRIDDAPGGGALILFELPTA